MPENLMGREFNDQFERGIALIDDALTDWDIVKQDLDPNLVFRAEAWAKRQKEEKK